MRNIEQQLPSVIKKVFGRSLHIRHVDSGSCNGCEFETTALMNPVYDIQRFGIDFVASPRHADMLLVTGGVTWNLEEALRKTYAAAASPKMLVAVGACACGGGILGSTYANVGGVDKIFPVSVYVPGCPPRPQVILEGILNAIERAHELKSPKKGSYAYATRTSNI
ncbi:NADH-quinone oxidoreductase subunit B family protein [Alicyclobacillus fastidiosus]|uniref:NADH-quinone oxidoreductase subunit B family protein n=1 Tax=Alicyclobacillus fastidiosus TaxID=392011 RepID=A0ABV5AI14_9BACL|nr:NADH-quinone oxidoreductase subunit B family protein [Alicyclobacillus fastidiosus]WEH10082.1 NADH-quinone oxidoreductase subunit B family protein [Alicyclobacillus fastidiosus]